MRRLASLLVLGVVFAAASPAAAQRGPGDPGGKGFDRGGPERGSRDGGIAGDIQKLKADVERLQADLRSLESHARQGREVGPMPRAKGEERSAENGRDGERRPSFGRGGFPGPGGFGPGGSYGAPPWMRGPGGFEKKEGSSGSGSSVEKRLDKLEGDIEEIKRLLRSRK